MSSSVSSERAFSQGGITISKHRNRLKGDIVEALQGLKSGIKKDIFLREPEVLSMSEGLGSDEELDTDNFSLDDVFIDDDNDSVVDEEIIHDGD